jgi:hypothetical protein
MHTQQKWSRYALAYTLEGIIPHTILSINGMDCDEFAVRLRYTVSPPFPADHRDGNGPLKWQRLEWNIEIRDDLGTFYHDAGGEADPHEGVRSVVPCVPQEAIWVMITIRPYLRDHPIYHFTIKASDILRA